jgi:hypothetical protein
MWLSVFAGLMLFLLRQWIPGAVLCAFGIYLLARNADARDKLGEPGGALGRGGYGMLANKPYNTARLTKWIEHIHPARKPLKNYWQNQGFVCPCGVWHAFKKMEWFSNPVEPEGRFALVCSCGVGHFVVALKPGEHL